MAKIDEIKEEIGWLKFWIGVIAASFMGMVSYINRAPLKTLSTVRG